MADLIAIGYPDETTADASTDPASAVPRDEPRLETLRDRPEMSS